MTTKADLLKAIRKECLDCSGLYREAVAACTVPDCPLFPFRLGDPDTKKRVKKPEEKPGR